MRTAASIVNEALYMMGDKTAPVTGSAPNFDNSAPGIAARYLYTPTVQAVARAYEWDFARRVISLGAATVNVPPMGFAFEYLYPANGIEVWQVIPATFDPYNPLPVNWDVGNALIASAQTKVVWTDTINALAVYNNQPTEDLWDAGFVDAVARRLSGLLAMALAGRPDSSEVIQKSSLLAQQIAQTRDG